MKIVESAICALTAALCVSAAADVELRNDKLSIAFGDEAEGFACRSIAGAGNPSARFIHPKEGRPGLWNIVLYSPARDGHGVLSNELTNVSAAKSVKADVSDDKVVLHWNGLYLPGEPGAVDVAVTVRLDGERSLWSIDVKNRSKLVGVDMVDFPYFAPVVDVDRGSALLPYGNSGGRIVHGRRTAPLYQVGEFCDYPSWTYTVQMSGFSPVYYPAYMDNEAPWLYVGPLDDSMSRKMIQLELDNSVRYRNPGTEGIDPGSAGAPKFETEVRIFPSANWWRLAEYYRNRAMTQVFMKKGPIVKRTDFPKSLADVDYWVEADGDAATVLSIYRKVREQFPGVNLGVHWYDWHHDFGPAPQVLGDTRVANCHQPSGGPSDWLPARKGVKEAVAAMRADGAVVMPYLNSRLWERDFKSFPGAAAAAATKRMDGTFSPEVYSEAGRRLVCMCPGTAFWQTNHADLCRQTYSLHGFNSLYLDQIGSMWAIGCYDKTHEHRELNGGGYWAQGYRKMLASIHDECSAKGVSLTTENFTEPYVDVLDGALTWNMRSPDDIPLMHAIFSGYTVFFTAPQREEDTVAGVRYQQARDFLWGVQLGWERPWCNGQWIVKPEAAEKRRFIRRLVEAHAKLRDYLSYGRLVGNADLGQLPTHTETLARQEWDHPKPTVMTLPVVMGTVWTRFDEGGTAVILVNPSDEDRVVRLSPPGCVAAGGRTARPTLRSYGSDSGREAEIEESGAHEWRLTIPAGGVAALVYAAPGADKEKGTTCGLLP